MYILLLLRVCVLFYFFYVIILFTLFYIIIRSDFIATVLLKHLYVAHTSTSCMCTCFKNIKLVYAIKLSLLLLTFPIDESRYLECHDCNYYSRSNKFSIQSL